MKKMLIVATVQSHIAQFHLPFIRMMKREGFEVHVAARDNLFEKNGLSLETYDIDKIYNVPFKRSPYDLENYKAYHILENIIRENNYTLVQCNTPVAAILTRICVSKKKLSKEKVVYMAHGFHFYKGASLKNWIMFYPIEKFFSKYTGLLITVNKEDYRFAKKHFNCKVEHIYGVGVSRDKFHLYKDINQLEKYKKKYSIKDGFNIICIGEFNNNKNQITLINSFSQIDKNNNVNLYFAGNGPKERFLKSAVYKLGLTEKIHFLGYTRDLEYIIPLCDCVISCSFREGMPLNVIEGLMCGKPVIASNNRGHKELIIDNYNGFLFDPHDSEYCAHLIQMIWKDHSLYSKLSSNAIGSVESYELSHVIDNVRSIYLSICKSEREECYE